MCPKDRDGWCAGASSAWSPAARIEPRRRRQLRPKPVALDRPAGARQQQFAAVADVVAYPARALKSGNIVIGDCGEPSLPPMIDHAHEMPGKAFDQSIRADIAEPLIFRC